MGNLVDIQTQINKLQKQANDIKAKEFDKTVREILSTMQAFGITAKDLQSPKARSGKKAAAGGAARASGRRKSSSGTKVPAKYQGPNGETWSGRGLTPRWLAALLELGKSKEDFAIKA